MSERDDRDNVDDDIYVLEDNGETLENFDLEKEERAAREVEEEASSEGSTIASAGSEAAVAELHRQNAELHDRLLRTRADIDNFRKRTEREKADFYRYALSDIMRELLPVLDNFERALTSGADSVQDVMAGVELIYKQLGDILAKAGLKAIDEPLVQFNPQIHEAVAREEDPSVPSHTVTQILQRGYVLNDRLIRPAMVKVAVGGEETPRPQPETDGTLEN